MNGAAWLRPSRKGFELANPFPVQDRFGPCCCQSKSWNCTSPCTRRGAFLPLPLKVGGCSTQRGLAQRDPLSTLSKFRTRQRTRQLFCGANAESPARSGLSDCRCWYKYELRGPTAYNVASSFCWKESAVNSRVIRLRRLCGGGVCP